MSIMQTLIIQSGSKIVGEGLVHHLAIGEFRFRIPKNLVQMESFRFLAEMNKERRGNWEENIQDRVQELANEYSERRLVVLVHRR